ncbi:MAG: ammonium transporter [Candidatus Kapabacteria bacterium]|nr:ammonium transporter [Candidatus Kapabacteria bacterium]
MKSKFGAAFVFLIAVCCSGLFLRFPAEPVVADGINPADLAWMLSASGLVLLMTPGLSFFYGGMVSRKNILSTMLQSFIALGVITVLYVTVVFSLSFGTSWNGIIGNPFEFAFFNGVGLNVHPVLSPAVPFLLFAAFQMKFAIITPALITGSFAERVKFSGYLLFISLFSIFIYAPLAHWTWHPDGFLHKWGVLDFAGGTVVHMSAGYAALAGAIVLGQRKSYHHHHHHTEPANIPYILLGTGMLWFGWFGFNAGSSLGANQTAVLAFMTTMVASASAMMTWVLYDAVRVKKISAMSACIGAVVGLVAITPAAGFVSIPQALFIGFISAMISNIAVSIKNKTSLDDTLDVFPCHGIGGISGMILTGVFAKDVGLVYGHSTTFLMHLLGLVVVSVYAFGGSYLLLLLTNKIAKLRVSPDEEEMGLDLSQHGEHYGRRRGVTEGEVTA